MKKIINYIKELEIEEFREISKKQYELEITKEESELILGYVEGHGYSIKVDNNKKTYLQDLDDNEDIEEEGIKAIISRVLEWNVELYTNSKEDKENYYKYKSDEKKLDEIWARF